MNIAVCIKQVPDSARIKIDPVTRTLRREGVGSVINPYDLHAPEEALKIKDTTGGRITVITMGPSDAETALKEALSLGADQQTGPAFGGNVTATILREIIPEEPLKQMENSKQKCSDRKDPEAILT